MWLETVSKLRPNTQEAEQVVIRDTNGTPIAVFVQYGMSVLFSTVWGDKDFEETLQRLGIKDHAELRVYEPKGLSRV